MSLSWLISLTGNGLGVYFTAGLCCKNQFMPRFIWLHSTTLLSGISFGKSSIKTIARIFRTKYTWPKFGKGCLKHSIWSEHKMVASLDRLFYGCIVNKVSF
jgi:hypothetical protein